MKFQTDLDEKENLIVSSQAKIIDLEAIRDAFKKQVEGLEGKIKENEQLYQDEKKKLEDNIDSEYKKKYRELNTQLQDSHKEKKEAELQLKLSQKENERLKGELK